MNTKPGETIRQQQQQLRDAVLLAVRSFEQTTDVTVQSVHCYLVEADKRVLDAAAERRVDVILKLGG